VPEHVVDECDYLWRRRIDQMAAGDQQSRENESIQLEG
jgi:hypothetical protein